MAKRKTKIKRPKKWKDEHHVSAYILASQGYDKKRIAIALDVSQDTIHDWCTDKPAFKLAIDQGHAIANHRMFTSFEEYVYHHLSPESAAVWDDLIKINKLRNVDVSEKVYTLCRANGEKVHQELWLRAMVRCNFRTTRACRMTGTSKRDLDNWMTDGEFGKLLDELRWLKKNFMEDRLTDLVAAGDKQAIMFVNRTANSDRGYGERLDVSGSIEHTHVAQPEFDLNEVAKHMSQDAKRELLQAVRKVAQQSAAPEIVKALPHK